ncbi:hypothetical protein [Sorangium sp. So ce693]|uniref:hypothetical protein n=1 Tax=Sorangium sp. So ce693 TaxID=3133318 RepID=UPI003F5EE223
MGDMMEFISNGRLKATRHQVVTPRERAAEHRVLWQPQLGCGVRDVPLVPFHGG